MPLIYLAKPITKAHLPTKALVRAHLARQTFLPCCGEKPEGTEHIVLWAGAQA